MESILERDFYPTPEKVIEEMLQGHEVAGKIILEPSAGSGNIVDYLQKNFAKEVIACEINGKLRSIVESKCRVITDDFLKVKREDVSHIDMIVMNPPFSDARRHILHAFEVAPDGCEIVSLCNSSDLSGNYYSTEDKRKVIQLVGLQAGHSSFRATNIHGQYRRRYFLFVCVVKGERLWKKL